MAQNLSRDGELGLHRVGTHKIVAENSDGACFETIINVKDTDECTVTGAWRHKCDASAACRNLRDRAREPDAAAAGAQGRLLPVPRAGASREGAVPVAVRLADDLG